jgi:hypothetical protein
MTTFTALGDSITLGLGDPVPAGGWRGWAVFLAEGLPGGQLHNLATTGAQAADVERSQLPTRRDEFTWMATKGTKWVLRRCTDLLPYLVAMAVRDCFRGPRQEPAVPAAVEVPETRWRGP